LIGTESLDGDTPLMEAGLDSLAAVEYGSILGKQFAAIQLPSTLMFDHPTTNMIAELLTNDLKEKMTVTEQQGGEEIIEEVTDSDADDSDDDSSSEDERPKKKKKKAKKAKVKKQVVRKVGGGEEVAVYKGPSPEDFLQTVKGAAMDLIGTESLDGDTPLMEAGLDSLAAVEYGSILGKQFAAIQLPSTLMFDHPTTNMIAELLSNELKEKMTVTEQQGGEEIIEEVTDSEADDSDDDESEEESGESDDDDDDDGGAVVAKPAASAGPAVYAGPTQKEITQTIIGVAADLIGTEDVHADSPLMESGLDSLAAVEFGSILGKTFVGVQLPSTVMFDHPSSGQIGELIYQTMSQDPAHFK
jgi:aryl carrier-like protein